MAKELIEYEEPETDGVDLEGIQDLLEEEGFDPAEIEELLFDPAPKKGRRKKGKKAKRYTPFAAGKKRKITARRKKPKGMLAKMKKFALPGAAGLSFLGAYVKRADELFNAGLIVKKSVYAAIEYDIKHFDSDAAMDRLKDNAGEIVAPGLLGLLIKETKVLGKYSGVGAEVLTGLAIGKAAKVVLDPPVPGAAPANRQSIRQAGNPGPVSREIINMRQTSPDTWEV